MSEEGFNSPVYSKNVIEFVTVANEYCKFMENTGKYTAPEFLGRIQKLLPLLYLKAALLPEITEEPEDMLEKFVSEMEYNQVQQQVIRLLGGKDDYQEVYKPGMQFSEGALTASISEDLADIYQDLKDFILLFRVGNEEVMESGLWECRNNFTQFWGQKLVNCLRAVHNLIYSEADWDDLDDKIDEGPERNRQQPDWLNDRFAFQDDDE
jgi:hypothetical protein